MASLVHASRQQNGQEYNNKRFIECVREQTSVDTRMKCQENEKWRNCFD